MTTLWEHLQRKYPDDPQTWEQDFEYRVATGGTDRAATLFANGLHSDDQRELPPQDQMTGKPPLRITR